jgi:signal transduction histidine kinase
MRFKLSFKFIILYIMIAVTSFILISTLGSSLVCKWIISNESMGMYETANMIADQYHNKSISTKSETDYSALDIIAARDDITVQIISRSGVVYLDTSKNYAPDYSYTIEGFDPSDFNSGYYTVGDFFGIFDSETMSVLAPIASNMSIRGYVAVHMPMSEVYAERESILLNLHIVEVTILLLTLMIIIMMNFWIFRPVKKITLGAQQLAAGNYKNKVVIKQNDEMGYLAKTLNYMASEMNEANENQHKFISNVSHDFRSPLTSIKGYVEAIKDKVIPYEMQDKYLDIILAETNRLTKLTQELLSLDNIDNRTKKINYTDFNINKLIKDTALSFEIACTNKNIKFNLALEGSELFVNADYGKIQQVMYNLIDNALKFSHNGSTIDIETTYKNKKVYVSVKDHGVGISSKDLPKIWNRFYKADSSRGKDRTGSGLGLSIVREIIQSHDQKITVVSTEGAGTEFYFTLNASESADAV